MPAVRYVLVANAARARLLSQTGSGSLEEVASYEHPESRLQNRELQSDGPGRNSSGPRGPAFATDQPDAHRVEAERFARELADALRSGRIRGDYQELALVAPPQFLGMLRSALDAPTLKSVSTSVPNDYTQVPLHELGATLKRHLEAEDPAGA